MKEKEYPRDKTGFDNWIERNPHWDKHKDGLLIFKDFCISSAIDTRPDAFCTNRVGLAKYRILNASGIYQGEVYLCERCLKTHKYGGWKYIRLAKE